MEKILFDDLSFVDKNIYSSGSYGTIRKCIFDGKLYAYKEFNDEAYLKSKKRLLNDISLIKENNLCTPSFWVNKNNKENSYLMPFIEGKDLGSIIDDNLEKKINILKKTKDAIIKMNHKGIIHSDLIESNILINNNEPIIIDFDNASYKKHKTNKKDTNDYSLEFINKYGICSELDIFLFNILTYSLINNEKFYLVRQNILKNNLKYFDNDRSKEICNELLLEKKPSNRFLIDTI